MKGKLTLVLGGSRSGKSEFAEKNGERSGKNIIYIATAAVRDEEMAERVKLHRKRRPDNWVTVEVEIDVLGVLSRGGKGDVFLWTALLYG
jgi:adenosylcobinamide kinase/adenosylcobinamide-phosphate guanylyltransferase